jgi:hypothetical protein
MACGVLYIIENLLELKCLKWACIAHLDIWNTNYGQKKGRESNCQSDSRLEKVKNQLDLLGRRKHATYCWEVLNRNYNFDSNNISIRSLFAKLWGSKIAGVPIDAILGLPLGSLGREKPFGCRLCGQPQSILWGGRWWLPPSPGCGEFSVSMLPVVCPSTKGAPTMHQPLCVGCVQAHVSEWNLSTLPSPIPELQHAPLPLKVLWAKEHAPITPFFVVFYLDSHLSPSRSWEYVMWY